MRRNYLFCRGGVHSPRSPARNGIIIFFFFFFSFFFFFFKYLVKYISLVRRTRAPAAHKAPANELSKQRRAARLYFPRQASKLPSGFLLFPSPRFVVRHVPARDVSRPRLRFDDSSPAPNRLLSLNPRCFNGVQFFPRLGRASRVFYFTLFATQRV